MENSPPPAPPADRSTSGYRRYAPERGQWALYIKTAQRLGFNLGEVVGHLRQELQQRLGQA